ncbi:D-sedoheptulose-7-phosphate isomerase [Marinifilum sp.]|uniref:D-sedoheptulose-7-phosphate isomerase n=1 Tax=Marinifilum sp. TaxID=2033137 RepID=UPI003BABF9F9
MREFIRKQISESLDIKQRILDNEQLIVLIDKIASICTEVYKKGGKTLLAGNGGSAADAQHIAGEFVSRFYFDRPGIPSIALTTDTSILTAIGNDYGYEKLFSRQIQAQGNGGDMFFAISTSGNSKNLIEAIKEAKGNNIITVGLTGETGGQMVDICDFCIKVPSKETPRIQEAHILIGHIICSIVEENIFGNLKK